MDELAATTDAEWRPLPRPWSDFVADPWWTELARSQAAVLMLDYDGTLAPFLRNRMEAVPYVGVPERLLQLAGIGGLRMVLISGRPASELRALLPADLKLEIWGSHGRERLLPGAEAKVVAPLPAQEEFLRDFERQVRKQGFSFAMETKVGSVALHTRGQSADQANRIQRFASSFVNDFSDGIELLPFDEGVELRATGRTKADVVREILSSLPTVVPTAYLGDDRTDEDGFVALQGSALAARILVRDELRPSAAQWWLRPPNELLAFLDLFVKVFDPEHA